MSPRPRKKRGAPYGNQNARKHGFYSTALTEEQQARLPAVLKIEDLDREIAVARVKAASIIRTSPDDARLLFFALNTLGRLVRIKDGLVRYRRIVASHVRTRPGRFLLPSPTENNSSVYDAN